MSPYRPAIEDLLATVRALLDATAPQLEGEQRYKLQVASYLLGICERQITVGRDHVAADLAVWSKLLDRQGHDRETLARALCADIRAGRFDADFDGLVDAVLARTIEDVRVVRPWHLDRGESRLSSRGVTAEQKP